MSPFIEEVISNTPMTSLGTSSQETGQDAVTNATRMEGNPNFRTPTATEPQKPQHQTGKHAGHS